jgi:putative transposase
MIPQALRIQLRSWLQEAIDAGARRWKALLIIGLTARCLQRWREDDIDARTTRVQTPHNALSEVEQTQVMTVLNSAEFEALSPTQIVPLLADQGRYIASESTMYRLLRKHDQLKHRASTRKPTKQVHPKALIARGPNQVASWDITYLPSTVRGHYWYAYVVMDVFSRKGVAWQVYAEESQHHASALIEDYVNREAIPAGQLRLHADNGAVMKGSSLYASLQQLGIVPSHSRPGVSNDNAFIESLFKTIKYRPENPLKPFESLSEARSFMDRLMRWYNEEHRHSGIQYVTPNQRHNGEDVALLEQRQQLFEAAKARHPSRWSGPTRDWSRQDQIVLNPLRVEEQREKQTDRSKEIGLSCPLIHGRRSRRRVGLVGRAPTRRASVGKWSG